jgi:hypothetical protein
MWEYQRLVIHKETPQNVFKTLNEMGEKGWEIIQYTEKNVTFTPTNDTTYIIVLKRKKKDT